MVSRQLTAERPIAAPHSWLSAQRIPIESTILLINGGALLRMPTSAMRIIRLAAD
jgi:hypothetical protein